jgi:RNA polymerase sigma-32 factor
MSKKITKTQNIEVLDAEILDNIHSSNTKNDSLYDEDSSVENFVETTSVEAEKKQLEILAQLLPVVASKKDLVTTKSDSYKDPLTQYIKEISKHKLLTIEEEKELVTQLHETGDIEAAKKLVMANLRLVVKISMEYKSAYKNVMDLIQEGNLGLMKAVSKYNPEKGAKLSYYSSWWIKSYVLKFILDNFRLIKIGTTADQKKLFYNLMREKERLQKQGIEPSVALISENLGVTEKSVKEMDLRLSSAGGEVSIDQSIGDESGGASFAEFLSSDEPAIDESLGHLESLEILQDNLHDFIADLKERDRDIFKKRLLSEVPPSLQSIADGYGVSRERIRQIEERLLNKLKVYMSDFLS